MLINKRCTVCHDDVATGESVVCGSCGKAVHDRCAAFERAFECRECADEPGVGAVEF